MMARRSQLLGASFGLSFGVMTACGESNCPPESMSIDGRCVAIEADAASGDGGRQDASLGLDARILDAGEVSDATIVVSDTPRSADAPRAVTLSLPDWVTVRRTETAIVEGHVGGDGEGAVLTGTTTVGGVLLSFSPLTVDGAFTLSVNAADALVGDEGTLDVEVGGAGLLPQTVSLHLTILGVPGERVPTFEASFVGASPPEEAGDSKGCLLDDGAIFMVGSAYHFTSFPVYYRYLTAVISPSGLVSGPRDFPWGAIDPRLANPVLGGVLALRCVSGDRILATTYTYPAGPSTEGQVSLVLLDRSGDAISVLSFPRTAEDCAIPPVVHGDFAYWGCNETLHRLTLPDLSHDTTYGVDGQVSIAPTGRVVGVDPTGHPFILVSRTQISRLLDEGTVDPSFGVAGRTVELTPPFGYATYVDATYYNTAVFVESDGAIVMIAREGSLSGGPETNGFQLMRYLPSGLLDPRFGGGGIVRHPRQLGILYAWLNDGDLLGWVTSVEEPPSRASGDVRFGPDGMERLGFYPPDPAISDFVTYERQLVVDQRRGRVHRLGRVAADPLTTFMVRSFWL